MMSKYVNLSKYMKIQDWYNRNYSDKRLLDSMNVSQIDSKEWMVEEIINCSNFFYPIHVEVVGAWFGWPLVNILMDEFYISKIHLFDIDKAACRVGYQYRDIFGFTSDQVGITNENYWNIKSPSPAQLVINCSSEHMKETFADFSNRYTEKCMFVVQSNNMRSIEDHINCVDSVEELIEKHRLNEVYYKGSIPIRKYDGFKIVDSEYTRFMVIGRL